MKRPNKTGTDAKREVTSRRRMRRYRRLWRLLVSMAAAAVAGCALGIALTAIIRANQMASDRNPLLPHQEALSGTAGDEAIYAKRILIRDPFSDDDTKMGGVTEAEKIAMRKGNCSVAQELWEEVRVLCWVMTKPENHATKAAAVKETWGRRCNSLFFMSSKADESLPTVALAVSEGRSNLWGKTMAAFSYLHEKGHLSEGKVDWVLKADDDTFVVMENLRYLLTEYDPENAIYVGLHFKKRLKAGFMSGGSGYVLSRKAATRFVTEALPGNNSCRNTSQLYEDVEMGRCMATLGAEFVNSKDPEGKHRFFPYQPERFLSANEDPKLHWLKGYLDSPTGIGKGKDCCSRTAISFHYVSPGRMREMYYLVYRLTPFGIRKLDDAKDQVTRDSNSTGEVLDKDAC